MSAKTQAIRADAIATELVALGSQLGRLETQLALLLGESSNAPPEGRADGTIDAARWTRMREVHDALFKLNVLLRGGE